MTQIEFKKLGLKSSKNSPKIKKTKTTRYEHTPNEIQSPIEEKSSGNEKSKSSKKENGRTLSLPEVDEDKDDSERPSSPFMNQKTMRQIKKAQAIIKEKKLSPKKTNQWKGSGTKDLKKQEEAVAAEKKKMMQM